MHIADAIVVGGGPAGSTCAWKLRKAGLDVVVLDRARFPRTKLCAGWVTPRALADLELDPGDYPHSLMTFDALVLHWKILTGKFTSRQHSIRRYEFDDFLLRRSGATVRTHKVRKIRRDNGDFVVDDVYRSKFLVGAGGTSCPVYRTLFRQRYPRRRSLQAATLEQEFAYDWQEPACHLWFFNDGLPGYAWYVPKANGYINIGLGGMAGQLNKQGGNLRDYWRKFTMRLNKRGLVVCDGLQPSGYSYFLRGGVETACDRNAYLVGDAVGLATRDLCEGIGPAIESALLAAQSIVTGSDYSLAGIASLSGQSVISRHLERRFAG
ncbi:NAD(P)/FAD-dependent oxidoreductase [Pseudomonadota bacterium]